MILSYLVMQYPKRKNLFLNLGKISLFLLVVMSLFLPDLVSACPMCGGVKNQSNSGTNISNILLVFIGLVYIPFIIIFWTIKKYSR
jgi:hypothetical protein